MGPVSIGPSLIISRDGLHNCNVQGAADPVQILRQDGPIRLVMEPGDARAHRSRAQGISARLDFGSGPRA